jgi:hypothetical protein
MPEHWNYMFRLISAVALTPSVVGSGSAFDEFAVFAPFVVVSAVALTPSVVGSGSAFDEFAEAATVVALDLYNQQRPNICENQMNSVI